MAKLKNIIKQLSSKDFQAIHDSLLGSNADKSAYLVKSLRERQLSDAKIMEELEVNTNAYYTLRSRLNQRIEEYLLQQMENPRTDVLKKVANINEIIFTKKKDIAIATLKKLEKELIDYDLSNELTIVYKSLKKLHINAPDYFSYSQLYNRHVAYMLAIDKAEDLLAEYFKKYGDYLMTGDETDRLALTLLLKQMQNVKALYDSHRLYVSYSCMVVFHRLFVDQDDDMDDDLEPIEDILDNVRKVFNQYQLDSIYYHLNLVFEFLKLEYYIHFKLYRKAEKFYEEVNDAAGNLLTNYTNYTYPAQFLITKMERHIRLGDVKNLHEESEVLFLEFEVDKLDVPTYITYGTYRGLACYYAGKYEDASKWMNNLLTEVNLKRYPYMQLEIKIVLAIQHAILKDYELLKQLINSIQRQVRLYGRENCEHIFWLSKVLKVSGSSIKRNKADKIRGMVAKYKSKKAKYFSPTQMILLDEDFISRLCKEL